MSRPIGENQHLIPQFYLRQFRNDLAKNNIYCFDKTTGDVATPNISRVAAQSDYYVATDSDGQPLSLEPDLSKVEAYFSKALSAVVETPTVEALAAQKADIADFLACQAHRTDVTRAKAAEVSQEDSLAQGVPHTEVDLVRLHLAVIALGTPQLAAKLLSMKWILFHNSTDAPFMPFWLTDYPFAFHPWATEETSSWGQEDKLLIFVPLTPKLMVMLCNNNLEPFAHWPGELPANKDWVELINTALLRESVRYIFSPANDFTLAQKLLAEHPDLADPNQKRQTVLKIDPPPI